MIDWRIGERYVYPTKEMCVKAAADASKQFGGLLDVVFERSYTTYSFRLCDPFGEVRL